MNTLMQLLTTAALTLTGIAPAAELRQVISLDGTWQVAEGGMDAAPQDFAHTIPVPGLLDMASPALVDPGPPGQPSRNPQKDPRRDAFWYRRTFTLEEPVPEVATLKVGKAMFGTRVMLNGTWLGDHLPSFTPGRFDARAALRTGENELLIRVGSSPVSVPKPIPSGQDDGEKTRFLPGIFDSVELILTGTPHIVRVQAVPEIEKDSVTIHTWVRSPGAPTAARLQFTVREASTGRVAGEGQCEIAATDAMQEGQITIAIDRCRLWSPEDPFLYELEVRGDADVLKTRFGMRSFRLDPATGRAILNGRPYFMRGSNVTLYRFFEDAERGDKPWREEWVRRLHSACRDMHWNSLRYCIGFPPESWYRIADEVGLLIQDEFPIWWGAPVAPGQLDGDELAAEYTEWLQERWNHPCVVIWDACNETYSPETGKAIRKVRSLDFSHRPWDNGWGEPVEPGDSDEAHPYHFIFGPRKNDFRLEHLPIDDPGTKAGLLIAQPFAAEKLARPNPIIINEYCGLWLNRDGSPTTLSRAPLDSLLGPNSTAEQRRHVSARYHAAITEFFRSHRLAAAVLHFCALGYSRPDGQTSDHWVDVEKLTWDPEFYAYVRDAFAPVGIMIDAWAAEYPAGARHDFPVAVVNDLYESWKGTVRLRLLRDGEMVSEQTQACEVPPLGRENLVFVVELPQQVAHYQLEAALVQPGTEPVRSLRDFDVQSKPLRIIIETDAGGDPDDEQSLVRFLVYANEFDIEGIIANRPVARDGENQNPIRDGLGIVRTQVKAYGACYANLIKHDARFPTADQLLSRTVAGYDDTDDGVQLILQAVDADDPRPVWFSNWGTDKGSAVSCLKRALDRVLRERGPEGYAKCKSRLRLSSDDQFGEHTSTLEPPFPLWVDTFHPPLETRRWYHRFSALTATAGGFDLERDVRTGHGPLGALYPANTGLPQKEGDTMAFLYLVPTGMNDPHAPAWGSWGGRYGLNEELPGKPYFWANQVDVWRGTTSRDHTLARWAIDLQNDFRARMDWCVADDFQKANHHPLAVLNADSTQRMLELSVQSGETVTLSARGSQDPDGDAFSVTWFSYREAGTFRGDVQLDATCGETTSLVAPAVGKAETIHVILQLEDRGEPNLFAYRRAIVTVRPRE